MRVLDELDELTHYVQARRVAADFDIGWHTIAAFNVEIIAQQYARECRENTTVYDYRVRKIKGR